MPAGGARRATVLGPADVEIADGRLTIVYAWGGLEAQNLALAIQTSTKYTQAPVA